ncbi:arabinose-5-phosphate isomerase [Phyllobacterium trifolii]|uniref:Arabinose-5-phosphate isomerase n=1 Tax=Phyllobacterium trifolii TaxID=300193 RepID=A0A839ULK0_9HYPH|nr:KpsF/GutQ family sugar-phosphate isomerase [Phyllobacterium trifolii]MBB3149750.1 arabinose-5-phosphate isomerase [Phyllobacterium trifolii]
MSDSQALNNNSIDLISLARKALSVEAEALNETADALGPEFEQVVRLFVNASGRIIVSGMGKSGHVGRKIAATLSSVGCPAFFIHPGEASHGDLGMLVEGDVLFALSNSGTTAELSDIVSFCQLIGLPIVSLTSDARSRLATASDIALVYPRPLEVCTVGMAPTTSTTVMMALGDAIAVCAMNLLGTTVDHFNRFHPGGKLGAQTSRVHQLMHSGAALPVVSATTSMREVILTISQKGFGIAIIRSGDNTVLGVITDGDMRRHIETLWDNVAGDIAHLDPIVVNQNALASTVLQQMTQHKISAVPVLNDEGALVGLLHIHDCLRAGL